AFRPLAAERAADRRDRGGGQADVRRRPGLDEAPGGVGQVRIGSGHRERGRRGPAQRQRRVAGPRAEGLVDRVAVVGPGDDAGRDGRPGAYADVAVGDEVAQPGQDHRAAAVEVGPHVPEHRLVHERVAEPYLRRRRGTAVAVVDLDPGVTGTELLPEPQIR